MAIPIAIIITDEVSTANIEGPIKMTHSGSGTHKRVKRTKKGRKWPRELTKKRSASNPIRRLHDERRFLFRVFYRIIKVL